MKKTIIISIFVIIFMISIVNALEYKKEYKDILGKDYGKTELKKCEGFFTGFLCSIGWIEGEKVFDFTVDKVEASIINYEATGTFTLYEEDLKPFSDIKFYNIFGSIDKVKRNNIYIEYERLEPYDYYISDNTPYCIEANQTNYCYPYKLTKIESTRFVKYWKEYKFNDKLPSGSYKWKIEGERPINRKMDFVLVEGISNQEMKEYAWLNSTFEKKREVQVSNSFSNAENLINYQVTFNITYDSDMQPDFTDLRASDSTETTELNFLIYNYSYGSWAYGYVWLDSIPAGVVNTTFYFYYDNSTTVQSVSTWDTCYFYENHEDKTVGTSGGYTLYQGTPGTIENYSGVAYDGINYFMLNDSSTSTASNWYKPMNINNYSMGKFRLSVVANASGWVGNGTLQFYSTNNSGLATRVILDNNVQQTNTRNILEYQWNNSDVFRRYNELSGGYSAFTNFEAAGDPGMYYLGINSAQTGMLNWDSFCLTNWTYNEPVATIGDEQYSSNLTVVQNSPVNNYNSSSTSITFNCSAEGNSGILNLSLLVDNVLITTVYNTTTLQNNLSFETTEVLTEGVHEWNCSVFDSQLSWVNSTTYSLNIDSVPPQIYIITPTSYFTEPKSYGERIYFNWTILESTPAVCIYNYNGTNITVGCNDNTTSFTLTLDQYLTFWANDSIGNSNYSIVSWNYSLFKINESFNYTAYETSLQFFDINISYDSFNYTDPKISFYYDGTTYDTVNYGSGNQIISNKTLDIPTVTGEQNKTFYWIINMTNLSGSYNYFNFSNDITVKEIFFIQCNGSLNTTYLNVSFKDEITLTNINMSLSRFNTNFYLGTGSEYESLTYSNTTDSPFFGFCFYPESKTIYLDELDIQYTSIPYYFARNFLDSTSTAYTNSSTDLILYGISSTSGIYSAMYITDTNSNIVSGATVTMTSSISGSSFTMTEITDGSGIATFWVNPNVFYTLSIVKENCTNYTTTLRPTQASYGFTINCGDTSSSVIPYTGPAAYIYDGVTYQKSPKSGVTQPGNYTFEFALNSSVYDLTSIKMELYDNLTLVNSSTATVGDAKCTIRQCYTNFTYQLEVNKDYRGFYYADFGQGFLLLESDGKWITINNTIKYPNLLTGLTDIFNIFETTIDEDGELTDAGNRAEFSRIVAVFFFLAIAFAFFNKATGYDSSNPGAFLVIMTIIITIASVGGIFYIQELIPSDKIAARFLNQYAVAIGMIILTIGFFLSVSRRQT